MKRLRMFRMEDGLVFILAVIGFWVYLQWYSAVFPEAAFRKGLPPEAIEARVSEALKIPELYHSPDMEHLERERAISLNQERLQRAHEHYGLKKGNQIIADSLPVYRWEFVWNYIDSSDFRFDMGGKRQSRPINTHRDPLRMEMDMHGRLMYYFARPVDGDIWFSDTVISGRDTEMPLLKTQILSVDSAQAIVTAFLKRTGWDGFASSVKPEIKFSMNKNIPVYEFTYSGQVTSLPETQKVRVVLRQYRINFFEVTYATADALKNESVMRTAKSVVEATVYVFFIVITLIYFFIKLRKGAFDVKLGLFYGAISMLTFCGFFYALEPHLPWFLYMLIFVFGGAVWLIVGGLTVAVSSSLCYEVWPDKYQTFESIRMGKVVNQRFGLSLFRGIFLGAIASGALIAVFYAIPGISVSIKEIQMHTVLSPYGAMYLICVTLFGYLISAHTQYLLTLAFVKKKLRQNWAVAAVGILISMPLPLISLELKPVGWYVMTGLLLGSIGVYALLRYDFLTFFIMATVLAILIIGGLFFVVGSPLQMVMITLFLGGLLLLMIAGLLSRETGEDILDYVPQYVKDMEERRRMEQEFEIARKIQTTMLCCRIPESPFLEIASLCEPAYEVGGDYYDFVSFPGRSPNRIGVVIGDVSGKGVSAAFYMTMIKGILQTQAQVTPDSTRETLIRANDIFYEHVERNKFISMIYAIFDFEKGSVQLSRAGHNPLVIKKSEAADPETLTPKGMALGLVRGKAFSDFIEEAEIRFKGGDVFVFYTDGLSEAMNKHGEEFGEERLFATIQRFTHQSATEILQGILDSVNAFVGKTPKHDDLTMIVVKIK